MFTKAEIMCGIAGFIIVLGIVLLTLPIILLGVLGIVVSTELHESN